MYSSTVNHMKREYYSNSIPSFLDSPTEEILGILTKNSEFDVGVLQRDAWLEEIDILKSILLHYAGEVLFEYSIPRMGRRIDAVILIKHVIFVLEFKVGEKDFTSQAVDQVYDYALDLKNFHEPSHEQFVVPILVATKAKFSSPFEDTHQQKDKLFSPIKSNVDSLGNVIRSVLSVTA